MAQHVGIPNRLWELIEQAAVGSDVKPQRLAQLALIQGLKSYGGDYSVPAAKIEAEWQRAMSSHRAAVSAVAAALLPGEAGYAPVKPKVIRHRRWAVKPLDAAIAAATALLAPSQRIAAAIPAIPAVTAVAAQQPSTLVLSVPASPQPASPQPPDYAAIDLGLEDTDAD